MENFVSSFRCDRIWTSAGRAAAHLISNQERTTRLATSLVRLLLDSVGSCVFLELSAPNQSLAVTVEYSGIYCCS